MWFFDGRFRNIYERGTAVRYNILKSMDMDARVRLGHTIYRCYSKAKIKELHPNLDYTIVGEVKVGSRKLPVGELTTGHVISHRDVHSPMFNRTVGFLYVGQDAYVVVLRSRRFPLLLLLVAILVFLAVLLIYFGEIDFDPRQLRRAMPW